MISRRGLLLYLINFQKYCSSEKKIALFIQKELKNIKKFIETHKVNYSLGYGFTGFCWLINYIINNMNDQNNIFDNEILNSIDDYVLQGIYNCSSPKDYDLFTGYIGLGVYLLERLPQKKVVTGIKHIINIIKASAIVSEDEVYWVDKSDFKNLGLAHGIPSIITFLSKSYQKNIDPSICKLLIESGINWILKQTLVSGISKFPYKVGDKMSTRISWCYGDMCIALMLTLAGKRLKRYDWVQKGVEIGLFSSWRRNLCEMNIRDACFCHGTTGNAHLFGRLYAYTKNEIFKESAVFWLNETLKKYQNENLSGLKTWWGADGYQYSHYLIEGLSGIGLSLLAAIGKEEPNWDSIFLLS